MKTLDNALATMQIAAFVALVWIAIDAAQDRMIAVGDKAPEFALTTDDGRTISRDDFGGKLLVVNFWATWCPPCVYEMPSLGAFTKHLASRGVVVLAVSLDEQERAYREFLSRLRAPFLTTRGGGRELAAAFGTFKLPETYLIDSTGRVLRKYVDARDWMDPAIIRDVEGLLQ